LYILGISAFYHDSAACLIKDGEIIAAAQEERFSRKKHDPNFPAKAAKFCLDYAGIKANDLQLIAFYDKPFIKFERILETYLAYAPIGIRSFLKAMPLWVKQKLWIKEIIKKELNFRGQIIFPEHHQSHAASAFFPSPFDHAAILTADGVGEWTTTSFGVGSSNKIKLIADIKFPHSLGLLYSAFTYFTGFKVNSGEYKLMGLAPYGRPRYVKLILDKLIDLKEDGSFKLNMEYFNFAAGLTMTNKKFNELINARPRKPESKLTQKYMDLAASIQKVTEEIMLRMARHVRKETGEKYLTLAGGVALNCVANGKILKEGIFEDIWIQPAAGDAGGALGAALFAWHDYLGNNRQTNGESDFQKGSYLGPEFSDDEIKNFLDELKIEYKKLKKEQITDITADLIADGNVVGWFQGRMEFGPRALGNRSILGDARSVEMQSKMNLKIKFRESFRPFAPSVLEEKVSDYFELDRPSPYMLLVADVRKERRIAPSKSSENLQGIEKINIPRSDIPAVTHVDYSARIQTVRQETNPLYYKLLSDFYRKHDCAVIVNTSFNVRGEPIVCTPREAYNCFMRTEMDYLLIGSFLLDKKDQKPLNEEENWRKLFELD